MPESIKEIVAQNLLRLRKEAGLTQRELGDALGTSNRAVHLWEKAVTWPESEKIDQMATLFKVPVTEFFAPPGGLAPPSLAAALKMVLDALGFDANALKPKR